MPSAEESSVGPISRDMSGGQKHATNIGLLSSRCHAAYSSRVSLFTRDLGSLTSDVATAIVMCHFHSGRHPLDCALASDPLPPIFLFFPYQSCSQHFSLHEYYVHLDVIARQDYLYSGHYKSNLPRGPQNAAVTCLQKANHFDYQQYNLQQERMSFMLTEILLIKMSQMFSPMSDVLPTILLPPSVFLRPKRLHASRAINEGAPGMAPVLHRGGIDLKDGPLFSALSIRYLGKMSGFQFVKVLELQSLHGMLREWSLCVCIGINFC
ncbi:hypothetical protein ZIOFF_048129 [Zingiber officinale]|uniref:Uncharacterized protein n=1 Tax=Zingiber officinale TaxID=94328 RepID=A0A8J5FZ90_ZINOF|nr:hypothetical protein ZIOFF_048129 [Zingiber officinale]